MLSRTCYAVISGGDSLKQKFDSISDTVTDNVRETGTTMMTVMMMMMMMMMMMLVI